ncbi:MAG TPA: hypothetical protein VGJ02_07170, partial [Pyrinomonadaceae bacterium]
MYEINETHDPNLKSWVESANDPNSDFPIQNLPFCEFETRILTGDMWGTGVLIGNKVLRLDACQANGHFNDLGNAYPNSQAFYKELLKNPDYRSRLRRRLIALLSDSRDEETKRELRIYLYEQ